MDKYTKQGLNSALVLEIRASIYFILKAASFRTKFWQFTETEVRIFSTWYNTTQNY